MKIASLFFFPRVATAIIVTGLIILTASCSSDPEPQSPPQVNAISPTSGLINTPVIITGTNFSPVLVENKVTFNGKDAVVTLATATQLTATVPLLAATGPVAVIVKGLAAANQPIFTVETMPEVSNISPTSGFTETSVIITGTNFSIVLGENKVTFNGKEAVVTVATATQLTATVPLLAETGPVIVTVKVKTAANHPIFTVLKDKIRLAMSSSLVAYDAAAANTWINITAAEYDNLIAEVSGSAKYAASEGLMDSSPNYGWGNNFTIGGNNEALKVPASNYIIAWSVRTGGISASSSLGCKLKISSSQTTGYIDYGPSLPNISNIAANTRLYFVLKKPTTSTPNVPSYTAVFNANLSLGNSVSILPVAEYSEFGDAPNLSSAVGADSYSQVISTPTKQW